MTLLTLVTDKKLTQLMEMQFGIEDVKIEDNKADTLAIYFESRLNRDLYLKNPTKHLLKHYQDLPDH